MSEPASSRKEWIDGVLREHEGALLRYAVRLTGDIEQARDIVQETFLRLCRADAAAIENHVGPWLFRICRQRALDQQKREQRMHTNTNDSTALQAATDVDPAASNDAADAGDGIMRLLATLPANQQEVVRLKFQAGLSYRGISEVTGLSVSNVGYLLHTAIARMRVLAAAEQGICETGAAHGETNTATHTVVPGTPGVVESHRAERNGT